MRRATALAVPVRTLPWFTFSHFALKVCTAAENPRKH